MSYDRLTSLDASFLHLERLETPMHVGALSVFRKGPELADDAEAQARMREDAGAGDGAAAPAVKALQGEALSRAKLAVGIFLAAAVAIVVFGMIEDLRPSFPSAKDPDTFETVKMPVIIQMVMYTAGGLMLAFCGAKAADVARTPVMTAGIIAVVSIVGLGWLGTCFYEGNAKEINTALADTVQAHPWVFSLALFGLSVVLFSQASTVTTLMPVGIALGLSGGSLLAMFPAVNGYFFLPTYATSIAAATFDRTGTTKLGRFVLDHSFMVPGLVTTAVAIGIGFVLAGVIL